MAKPISDETPIAQPPLEPVSAWDPMKRPVFRMLWTTWLVANTCMWMNDVAAAWMMTSMTTSPIWVALVLSAATLPVFLLGLPSGALASVCSHHARAGTAPRVARRAGLKRCVDECLTHHRATGCGRADCQRWHPTPGWR